MDNQQFLQNNTTTPSNQNYQAVHSNTKPSNKKKLFTGIGILVVIVVAVILIFVVFAKSAMKRDPYLEIYYTRGTFSSFLRRTQMFTEGECSSFDNFGAIAEVQEKTNVTITVFQQTDCNATTNTTYNFDIKKCTCELSGYYTATRQSEGSNFLGEGIGSAEGFSDCKKPYLIYSKNYGDETEGLQC